MAQPQKIGSLKGETRAMLERMWRLSQANAKMLQEKGYKLCTYCRSVWIKSARPVCAVCECNRKEGRKLCSQCRSVWIRSGDICISCQNANASQNSESPSQEAPEGGSDR